MIVIPYLILAAAALSDFPIDTVRVDLDDRAVGLYGCRTVLAPGAWLSADCTGSVLLETPGRALRGPVIDVSAVGGSFEHWADAGRCRLLWQGVGTYGEAQYEVYCGDVVFLDGFES